MKVALIFSFLFASSLAASVPAFEKAVVYKDSIDVSTRNSRIVHGFPAGVNQIPYQASVLTPGGGGGFSVCGGSIISNAWVLSAAHCTVGAGAQRNLRFGTINLLTGGIAQTSFNAINHPQYNPANLNNDISLVSIPTPLAFTAAVQSIRLPHAGQATATFVGVSARVSGWGQTHLGTGVSQTLNWVDLQVIPNAQCAGVFGTAVIVPHVVCGLNPAPNANQGHCGGDSGGPFALNEGGTWTQIGVVSFGAAAGCTLGFPHGYMRTSWFLAWINSHTGIAVRPS